MPTPGKRGLCALCLLLAVGASHAYAQAPQGATTIQGHYSQVTYWTEGDGRPILWDWSFTLRLSGANAVHEEWSGHNQYNVQRSRSRDSALGAAVGNGPWRVLGPSGLQKTVNFRQHILRITVTTQGRDCRLNVEFRLKPGFTDIYVPRANGEWSHFSLPQLREASCTIE